MFIRIGMRADTNAVSLYNHRITGTDRIFACLSHGIHGIEHIFSIAVDNLQILETGEVLGYFTISSLFGFRNRDAISVILYNENHRKTFQTSSIDSLVNKSFGSSRFSVRSDCYSFMPIIYHCSCYTRRMQVMRSGSRRYIFNMPFRFGEVIRHMTSAATGIGCFRNAVQYNLFRSHSCRKHSQHISVIREQEIFSQCENLTDSQLDTIMPRIRSMV